MEDDRYTRITLRIPKDLHAALTVEADLTSKSLNAEIIGRLKQSFGDPKDLRTTLGRLIEALDEKARELGVELEIKLGYPSAKEN